MYDHVMVDIEGLGSMPGGVIPSIGAVRFEVAPQRTSEYKNHESILTESGVYEGRLGKEFYLTIDVLDSLLAGLTTNPETCAWWAKQHPSAIDALDSTDMHTGHRQGFRSTLYGGLEDFATFISSAKTVWAKGPDYDLVGLAHAYNVVGLPIPWKFRKHRCVRTVIALGNSMGAFEGAEVKHNALDDAKFQARQTIRVYEKLGKEIS